MPSPSGLRRNLAGRAWAFRDSARDAITGLARRVAPGTVALTFDDGPHPSSTPRILDVLGELEVRATFFCVGRNAEAYPELVRRAVAEGHEVGSHSFTHPQPLTTPRRVLLDEYGRGRRAVEAAAGRGAGLVRPPHGELGLRTGAIMRLQGLTPWLWTVDPEDWIPGASAERVAVVAGGAGSGDVVVLHDWVEEPWAPEALDRSATVRALPGIVRSVRARGLRLTTLTP